MNVDGHPIPSTGLTTIVQPEKPSLDIVFVHGFTGHPVRTWTHRHGDPRSDGGDAKERHEPPSKIQKINRLFNSQVRVLLAFVGPFGE